MSEADTCRRYTQSRLDYAGSMDEQIHEQVTITSDRITPVGDCQHMRGLQVRPDYILDQQPFYPLTICYKEVGSKTFRYYQQVVINRAGEATITGYALEVAGRFGGLEQMSAAVWQIEQLLYQE